MGARSCSRKRYSLTQLLLCVVRDIPNNDTFGHDSLYISSASAPLMRSCHVAVHHVPPYPHFGTAGACTFEAESSAQDLLNNICFEESHQPCSASRSPVCLQGNISTCIRPCVRLAHCMCYLLDLAMPMAAFGACFHS